MLLADEHAPPDTDVIKPSTGPDEDQDSEDEAEGWQGKDRDVGDEEDNNDEQVIAALYDLDVVTAARFGVLYYTIYIELNNSL